MVKELRSGVGGQGPGARRQGFSDPRPLTPDPLEIQLAQTIVTAVEQASGLEVRVGIADGKFAAYVAAVLAKFSYPKGAEE
jgi:hypothetical protein